MSTVADLPAGFTRVRDRTMVRLTRGGILEAEATFRGPWSAYADFLEVVGGTEEEITYPGGITVSRIVPLKFPSDSPLFDSCYAVDCEMVGNGMPAPHDTEGITYELADSRVYFRSEAWYNFGDDRPLVSYSFGSGLDMVTRPGTTYVFPSDDLRLNQDAAVPVPWRDFAVTMHNLIQPDEVTYDALLGKVNSADFYSPNGIIYPAGTVLYLGPSGGFTRTIGNITSWTITHRLKYRQVPHNMIMRPDGTDPLSNGGFEAPVRVGSSERMIRSGDLMALYGVAS
jgi:hypothetical protein